MIKLALKNHSELQGEALGGDGLSMGRTHIGEKHLGCYCSNPKVVISLNNTVEWRS